MPNAFDVAGLGSTAPRRIVVDRAHRIDIEALRETIAADRRAGRAPLMVVANAGTVDIGAIDDLVALANVCAAKQLWMHVGGLAILSADQRHLLRGIERADSIALDFYEWLHVPYDAGCIVVRDAEAVTNAQLGYASRSSSNSEGDRSSRQPSLWPC